MKIAVNTRLLLKDKLEGIGWFTYETLKRITRSQKDTSFYFIFDRPFDDSYIFSDNITPVKIGPPARHPFLFYLWFEKSIPYILKKINPDLFLSPDGYLSLKTPVKSLSVIHDLNFEHYPEDLPWLVRKYYQYFFPKFANKAERIATVSEFSKKDIQSCYNVPSAKIDVVYNGANQVYRPLNDAEINITRNNLTKGHPYFIFIGSLIPRKNLIRLFEAFDIYKSQANNHIHLLIVGEKKWWTKEMQAVYTKSEHKDEIIFTGRLQAEELEKTLGSALALTYVSYFEGFGIPIIEAFQAGVPVITSNITSMPEIAGNAALLCDPFDPKSIAEAMYRITQEEDLKTRLTKRGFERLNHFSWDKTAEKLWSAILQCYES